MQLVLRGTDTPHHYPEVPMSRRTTAPQIEALEPEYRGVSWGVGEYECPQAIDIQGNTGK